MSDSVVTENEIGGWHCGRTELFTASEDKDHIAVLNDHLKRDVYDGPNENEKIDEETKRIESTDSETTPFITAETAEVTGEEHLERSTMNDVVGIEETTNETGERQCGRLVLRTVNEDEDFIAIRNDLVEHEKDEGMDENKKNQAESRGSTSVVAVVIARESDAKYSDRITRKLEADRIKAEGHHARYPHLVAEAGSIVLHVSNNMNEGKKNGEDSKDGEEEGETAAAKETEEISRKGAEIRRLIEERRSTPKEEKQQMKEVEQKHQKMYQRQEKSEKATS